MADIDDIETCPMCGAFLDEEGKCPNCFIEPVTEQELDERLPERRVDSYFVPIVCPVCLSGLDVKGNCTLNEAHTKKKKIPRNR